VLEEAFDEPALCQLRAVAGEAAGAPGGMRLQQLDKINVDVFTLRNATTQHAHVQDPLPPIAPQYIIDGERVLLSAALQVRIVVMLCTTAQSIAIKVSVDDESVGELASIRVASELSTALDFDERGGAELAKGANGVLFAGTWCGQPVAVKLPAGGVLAARSRRPRGGGAPARSAAAQEHRRLPRHLGSSRRAAAS
jgi:hypothetical protein